MWSGLWQKHARYRETTVAIAYEQQGFFEQAQVCCIKSLIFFTYLSPWHGNALELSTSTS